MSKLFYIQDTTVHGDLVLWWGPNWSGYTSSLDKAGVYEEEEARVIEKRRGTDIARPKEEIDALAFRAVSIDTLQRKYGRIPKKVRKAGEWQP